MHDNLVYYVFYHDYSRGLRLSGKDRVAEVRVYGPFDDETKASIWAQHDLIGDNDHTWQVRGLSRGPALPF